jgi:hypothetical protein
MNKSEASWLVIKTLGVLALFQACKLIFSAIFTAYLLSDRMLTETNPDLASRISLYVTGPETFRFILYSLSAIYLLRHGRKLHAVLMHEKQN